MPVPVPLNPAPAQVRASGRRQRIACWSSRYQAGAPDAPRGGGAVRGCPVRVFVCLGPVLVRRSACALEAKASEQNQGSLRDTPHVLSQEVENN